MKKVDYDLVIIGGGPAGLTAGLYAARARIDTILIEKTSLGGQTVITDWIENYPGFPEGISGTDLTLKMQAQAEQFNLKIEYDGVQALDVSQPIKTLQLSDKTITAHAIILATGATPKKLDVPGEDLFFGKGVSSCATCDGPFYKDRVVAAVGGGDTAVQESIYLTKFVRKVYLIHRRDKLRATKILQERALSNEKIEILWDTVLTRVGGGLTNVETVDIKNLKSGQIDQLSVSGCFIWVGIEPNADFLKNLVELDDYGFVKTDLNMATSVPGVFAAGDGRSTSLRQIATAVGDAAMAAYSAEHYLSNIRS
jgi:thioredoxin reductase (NADPH)